MKEGRDHWYHELMARPHGVTPRRWTPDISYLYTSGTTGKPKASSTLGGYLVGTCDHEMVFDLKDDVFLHRRSWLVTGHSYVVRAAGERRNGRHVRRHRIGPKDRFLSSSNTTA
jgi:acyl-coenzyme A synthetase/AMP-(fatty) acid ligase